VARAKRELLLRVHRHRLRREDLEDAYSQATLELLARVRQGRRFASRRHVANALELRFLSRVQDHRRAVSGRSPMQAALEGASSLDALSRAQLDVADARAGLEELVQMREELRAVRALAAGLSADQRMALASQLAQIDASEVCGRCEWSAEKYRKLAQRARTRLRHGLAELDVTPSPFGRKGQAGAAR